MTGPACEEVYIVRWSNVVRIDSHPYVYNFPGKTTVQIVVACNLKKQHSQYDILCVCVVPV